MSKIKDAIVGDKGTTGTGMGTGNPEDIAPKSHFPYLV